MKIVSSVPLYLHSHLRGAHKLCDPQVEYQIGSDEEGGVTLACQHAEGGQLYPEEVSAQVLAYLLDQAQTHLKATISKAVISVSLHVCPLQGIMRSEAHRPVTFGECRMNCH